MSAQPPTPTERSITVPEFLRFHREGRKLVVVTAYDFTMARLVEAAGVDCVLVGDSLGMVVQGHPHCLAVTMDDMVYHTRLVARALSRALVVADLPFLSYQVDVRDAVRNAGRLIQEGGATAVKLEGGARRKAAIEAIVAAEIPVMGHVGLTPQSVHRFGGFKVQRQAEQLFADAKAVEEAGAFAVVIECVPAELARQVTAALHIPTIGIGAGAGCSGQVLVLNDLLGLSGEFRPKFVKSYAGLGPVITAAVKQYGDEVRRGEFPGADHEFK